MYRGVLFMQQGDTVRARQDLERLRRLDARLAAEPGHRSAVTTRVHAD